MSSSGWEVLDVCGIENCRTKKYKRDTDGYLYCKNGHRHEAALATGEDDGGSVKPGLRVRKQEEQQEIVYQHLSGHKAFELYLHCYQLILRKQVYWFVNEKGFPKELEALTRELWGLRLQQLHTRVEDDLTDSESQSRLYSSQSEPEAATDDDARKSRFTRTRGRELDRLPKLIDSLALCYLAAVLMHVPMSLGQLQTWVNDGGIIYYSAIGEVPHHMLCKLPGEYHQPLQPSVMLKSDDLQRAVAALAIAYEREFNLEFPPINYPPLLFYFIQSLALPLDIYGEVKTLAAKTTYDFRLPSYKVRAVLHPRDFPEAQLMALIIIAVKIAYPFEETNQNPMAANNAATTALDWNAWTEALQDYKENTRRSEKLEYKQCLGVTEDSIFRMDDQQIDDYLDWYGQEFSSPIIHEHKNDFRRALLEIFPYTSKPALDSSTRANQATTEPAMNNRLKKVLSSLRYRETTTEAQDGSNSTSRLPGSNYRMVCKIQELDGHGKVFITECADLIGMSVSRLLRAVFYTEKRLNNWVKDDGKEASRETI